ncbi:MAG: transglycosylase SLT domain-containing protein [Xanthomonadales bacterium]
MCLFTALCAAAPPAALADPVAQRATFSEAWTAAREGRREQFESLLPAAEGYLLYPYLRYEDLRHRRAAVPAPEMADFLAAHRDWAFADGLETVWLRTLGKRGRWQAVLRYGGDSNDTEVRCHVAHARIRSGQTDGLLAEARTLWAVGKSQPDACDPVFDWLRRQNGITSSLAWERIDRAMTARERRLTRYLARYLDAEDRVWADRWYEQDRSGYRRLARAASWPDTGQARRIVDYGLRRLARSDADAAWRVFATVGNAFAWSDVERGGILAELALWSAVERNPATAQRMAAVPPDFRDARLYEWWARFALASGDWRQLADVLAAMPAQHRDDARWRYWAARAALETGAATEGREQLAGLAGEANFYGFLAADALDLPYSICPLEPQVAAAAVDRLAGDPPFARALELRRAGLPSWARREWNRAVRDLDRAGLRTAAALATRELWPDRAIAALGNSGDLRWYEWRFPKPYRELVDDQAQRLGLDAAWIMGLMRSESALAEDAVSPAGARGLMQLTPGTARQLAREHGLAYQGTQQLMQAGDNILFGTTYLRDLLDRFAQSPVLAAAAYNAGPRAVERWLADDHPVDPVAWIDTLPYFETRDYVPRVLAFTTLYDWRMDRPVTRVSARMPPLGAPADTVTAKAVADVVCRVSGQGP